MNVKAVYFDMDETLAHLSATPDWVDYLHNESTMPYEVATPMVDTLMLNDLILLAKELGVEVGIISWGSINSSDDYLERTEAAKREWVAKYLPSVDSVVVAPYGTPKVSCAYIKTDSVLIDDNVNVRKSWDSATYNRSSIDPCRAIEFMAELTAIIVKERNSH